MSLRIVIIYFASLVVGLSTSLTKHCDYFQKLDPNVTYQLHSPKNSKLNSKCRWAAEAPEGQNVLIDCKEIKIPFSTFCANDALLISTNGRVDLRGLRLNFFYINFLLRSLTRTHYSRRKSSLWNLILFYEICKHEDDNWIQS
jgi:hypothetical protein